ITLMPILSPVKLPGPLATTNPSISSNAISTRFFSTSSIIFKTRLEWVTRVVLNSSYTNESPFTRARLHPCSAVLRERSFKLLDVFRSIFFFQGDFKDFLYIPDTGELHFIFDHLGQII